MRTPNLGHVFVKRGDDLAHAVVPLGAAVGHDQVGSDGRKPSLAEIVGKPQLGFIIAQRDVVSLDIHSLPLLAEDGFGVKRRREDVRKTERTAYSLDGNRLVSGRARRQTG